MIGGKPEEIAITSGASTGISAVALGLEWRRGDELITAAGEFPLQYTTWLPMQEREGVVVRRVAPSGQFLDADDLIAALTPRTRLVSASLVRFNDASLLNARKVADACHAQGSLLLLDVSQCCGALPIDVNALGADFMICAGYKWLLGPYGTGFFWTRLDNLSLFRPGPFYWMATEGLENFSVLDLSNPKPSQSARRWDAPEWASYYNLNVATMAASVEFVAQVGPGAVLDHTRKLIDRMFEHLPPGYRAASPLDASGRGSFGCFQSSSVEQTTGVYARFDAGADHCKPEGGKHPRLARPFQFWSRYRPTSRCAQVGLKSCRKTLSLI